MNPIALSWSLNNLKASHDIIVYGEKTNVKRFIDRLNEELQTIRKNAPPGTINILSITSDIQSQNLAGNHEKSSEKAHPKEFRVRKSENSGLLSSLVLLAVGIATLFISSIFGKGTLGNGSKSSIDEKEALKIALNTLKEIGVENQELKEVKTHDNRWTFRIGYYEVDVDSQGKVVSLRRLV